MIITCNKCSTRFNLDDSLVLEGGSKCRCTVCKNIFTAYPLSLEPEPDYPEPEYSEPQELEQASEELSDFDFESDLDFESALDDEPALNDDTDLDDKELAEENLGLEMEDLSLSSEDSDIETENSYIDTSKDDLEIDDDFSFDENIFDMEEETRPQTSDVQKTYLESEDKNIESETIESEDKNIEFETIEFEDDDFEFEPVEEDLISFDEPDALSVEKDESENEDPNFAPDLIMTDEAEPPVTPEKKFPEEDTYPEEDVYIETENEMEDDLPEQEAKEVYPHPQKEKKVIIKPKPMADERPEPIKKKKLSFFKIVFIILMLIFLSALGVYIFSMITGYKLPAIEQYLKKPAPEISEARPIPNQKSVNGRFITNSTAGTLFVITGRVENPSNIAYSHIEIRGALITTSKKEAKIKKAFCGNIIPEDMLKTGNIADIDILLALKEGAHKINVNVPPGGSVPFMLVFSDLPEKLENFTVKVAGFEKAINNP
ncbi:MAG: hypothetical protein DRH26_08570 [Deltaproteobacteria bacterium]|nr:MAG: hypothetical protein DRH26_08570 [Deltaproteobacteria bacterium]